MRLTVLGSSASHPAPGDACSGYLVTEGDTRVLLDCGSGVLSNLQHHVPPAKLDAIVISHLHPDHYIDLVALRYGLRYGDGGHEPVRVYLPPGGRAHLERLSEAISRTQPFFEGALALEEYEPHEPLEIGACRVTPHEVEHGVRSFALCVESGRKSLLYSSDTVACDALVEAACGADLLLAEATLGGGAPDGHEPRTHMSAAEAGEVAHRASVDQLVLTHFWYTADRQRALAEARECFDRTVSAATPHATVNL
ncbi:MAG: MBL fold metallo-hydrolase [Dehalococcoidia bacterium]|nr:MBL fold metallo-hydrolase [Dehalococcoidia bacterium]